MTTIATDGRSMAADSLETTGGDVVISDKCCKIRRLLDGSIIGASGDAHALQVVGDWFDRGAPESVKPTGFDATILRLMPDGTVLSAPRCLAFRARPAPAAIGTGQEFALGAMAMGADAKAAVEVAIRYDVHSGGQVTVIEID